MTIGASDCARCGALLDEPASGALRPPPPLKPPLVLAAAGAALVVAAFALRLGGFSLFLLILGAGVGIIGLALAVVRVFPGYRRMQEAQEALEARKQSAVAEHARAGATKRRSLSRGEVISGEHAGVRYEHYLIAGGKSAPPRAAVSVPTSAPGEFQVLPESGTTQTVKALGMVEEFQSGDLKLDLNFYFSGTTDEYVREVFAAPENVAALRALIARGFDQVEKTAERLIASRADRTYLGIDEVRAVVELLRRLRLPMTVPGVEGKRLLGKRGLYVVRGAAVTIFVTGLIGFSTAQPLVEGWTGFVAATLALVVALSLAALAAAYFLLRGRSMSAGGLVELLLLLPLLVGGILGTLALANERLDASEAEERQVKLVRYWSTYGSKGTTYYHLQFEAWRGAGTVHIGSVSRDVYLLAGEGQIWKLRLRRGLLNRAWVEEMAPIAR